MQISQYIANRFRRSPRAHLMVGVCGRAGAGKTTLVQRICESLRTESIASVAYSGDWRFILDSKSRREWLNEKWRAGLDAYLTARNQFSWWDFDAIFRDLEAIRSGAAV